MMKVGSIFIMTLLQGIVLGSENKTSIPVITSISGTIINNNVINGKKNITINWSPKFEKKDKFFISLIDQNHNIIKIMDEMNLRLNSVTINIFNDNKDNQLTNGIYIISICKRGSIPNKNTGSSPFALVFDHEEDDGTSGILQMDGITRDEDISPGGEDIPSGDKGALPESVLPEDKDKGALPESALPEDKDKGALPESVLPEDKDKGALPESVLPNNSTSTLLNDTDYVTITTLITATEILYKTVLALAVTETVSETVTERPTAIVCLSSFTITTTSIVQMNTTVTENDNSTHITLWAPGGGITTTELLGSTLTIAEAISNGNMDDIKKRYLDEL